MTSITEILPTELTTAIIERLASPLLEEKIRNRNIIHDEALDDLKACSLACRHFVSLCQKYIFRMIELNTHDTTNCLGKSLIGRFSKIVESSPIIGSYVQEVTVWITPYPNQNFEDYFHPETVASALRSLTNPKTVGITVWGNYKNFDWNDVPHSLTSEFYRLFGLPTITKISLHRIRNFHIRSVALCLGLQTLVVEDLSVLDEIPSKTSSTAGSLKPIQLPHLIIVGPSNERSLISKFMSSTLSCGSLIFDFGRLETLHMQFMHMDEMREASSFLREIKSPCLKTINFAFPQQMDRDEIAVLQLYQSLNPVEEAAVAVICHTAGVNDNLLGMCAFLQNLSNNTRIQVLTICAEYRSSTSYFVQDPNWEVVNDILLTRGWSSLTRVDVKIYSFADQESLPQARFRAAILRKLPRTHLKGLASNKSFKFSWSLKSIVEDPRGFEFDADL